MNAEVADALQAALKARMQGLATQIASLKAEGRVDEANLQKAAQNIYGIFLQLAGSAQTAANLPKHLQAIPQNWHAARKAALEHGDYARVAAEDAKLSALSDIQALYTQITGEELEPACPPS